MPLSEAAQRALDKAAARAARVAERDAGLGDPDGPQPNYPSEKKTKALEKAKEESRCAKSNPSSSKALKGRLEAAKLERGSSCGTTVPGSVEKKDRVEKPEGGTESASPAVTTPKPAIKRSDTDRSSPTKKRRDGRLGRSPTVHYSPRKKTAVKAKAKPSAPPKEETPQPSKVHGALNRKSTVEIAKPDAAAKTATPAEKPNDPSRSQSSAESEDERSGGEDKELSLDQVNAQKAARARYMRFYRSLRSKRSPPEIRQAGKNAKRCSSKLAVLYEQWLQCEGHWTESAFFKEMRSTSTHRKRGARRWMTVQELSMKYGSQRVALRIKAAKEEGDADVRKNQIRDHPDVPGDPELRQYLVWDVDGEEDIDDTVTSSLFQAVDRDTKEGKAEKTKRKRKRSSSSSSASDSSSSSDKKKAKKGKKGSRGKKGKKAKKSKKKASTSKSSSESSSQSKSAKKKEDRNKGKAKKTDKDKEETAEQRAKREQKELEAKAKEEKNNRLKKSNKVVSKLQSALTKASMAEMKAGAMSAALKQVFVKELSPHKATLQKKRDGLQKVIDSLKGGGDITLLDGPESDGETAVTNFLAFMSASNMK